MKKRLISLLLIAAMVIAIFPIGVSAATETVDGVKYTTVSTAAELKTALGKGGNILLKNDIVLDSSFDYMIPTKAATVLNGNGFSLIYEGVRKSPLLCFSSGRILSQGISYIKNIGFGTKDKPMTLSANTSLFMEEGTNTCLIIFENADFYLQGSDLTGSRVGGLYNTLTGGAYFYGCSMDATLDINSSSGIFGGWVGEVSAGDMIMTDCTTSGSLTGNAAYMGAVVGQISGSAHVTFTDSTNLADVTGPLRVAGFAANVGKQAMTTTFTGCVNYGDITSTGTGYDAMAGGLLARSSNIQDQGGQRLRVFYDCINYGKISSGAYAGGLVGASHDYDNNGVNDKYIYFTFENCINYGEINGADYAGGMIGLASAVTMRAEVTDCVNVGKITSANGYAGNFAGMLSSGVVTGGFAAGVISTKEGTDVLAPANTGKYKIQEGTWKDQTWPIIAQTASNVKYIGSSESVADGITKVTDATMADALKEMSALCGVTFVAADPDDANAYVVAAEPALRGVQQSVAVNDGKVTLRFVAGVNALKAYDIFGIKATVYAGGEKTEVNTMTVRAYTALNAVSNGSEVQVDAKGKASNYLYAVKLPGIALADDVVIEVTPYALGADGTEYVGKMRVVSCKNGNYQLEPMVINGLLLSDYAIVYANSNKLSEKLLATRMANEIAQMTGAVVPVITDKQTTEKTAKILIGNTTATTVTVEGRTICVQPQSKDIVISGTDTAELSEAITYFLDTIYDKAVAGERSWSFDSLDVPVDEAISIMAYNMGAQNDNAIKMAEWDLITDYLPDIMTFQEPWAGFLDDFLNNYAVQPAAAFQASSSDDDVMASDVNNKAFTGKGYYGVYWGLPRWTPTDANHNGKASYSVILYAKDRFTVDESKSGTFWLSNTPDVSGSKIADSKHVRCATYATLIDRNTGKTFIVVNVHLDTANQTVKGTQAEILVRELSKRVDTSLPIFVTGDMNSEATGNAIKYFKTNTVMQMTAVDEVADYTYRNRRNIDWIFTNCSDKLDVMYYKYCWDRTFLNNIWNDTMIMGRPSDHPAVYARFTFK